MRRWIDGAEPAGRRREEHGRADRVHDREQRRREQHGWRGGPRRTFSVPRVGTAGSGRRAGKDAPSPIGPGYMIQPSPSSSRLRPGRGVKSPAQAPHVTKGLDDARGSYGTSGGLAGPARMVRAAASVRDGAARRDPQRAAREEPARHRGAAVREEGHPAESRSRRCARGARSTAPTTTCTYPKMGSVGCRFGRNVPLEHVNRRTPRTLLMPNPRVVSRELMTRDAVPAGDVPQPARRVVDSVHGARLVRAQAIRRPSRSRSRRRRATTSARRRFACRESVPDPAPAGIDAAAGVRQPQQPLVGRVADLRLRRRRSPRRCAPNIGGKLRIEPTGLLPVDPETGVHFSGFTDNWWIGLAMLHTLFTLEHNHVCDLLAHEHPDWTDEQLFTKARLITSALMAKIHTVEWTPAILPHPVITAGDERELVRARRRRPAGVPRRSSTTTSSSAASSDRRPTITPRRTR